MRYATLAFLLVFGVFGMMAPAAVQATPAPVITVDVTGEDPVFDTDTFVNVQATIGGTTGNYYYNVTVKINGNTMHNKNYLGSGATIDRAVSTTGWGIYDAGNTIEFKVTVSGVFDTYSQTIQ